MTLTPGLIDAILALVALEALLLGGWLLSRERADAAWALVFFLASGAALLAGLRFSLQGGDAAALAALGFAFLSHVAALVLAWGIVGDVRR